MKNEIKQVSKGLQGLFASAADIYINTDLKECEVQISVDEFRGEISERLVDSNVHFFMVDYWDTYPYKYVFSYKLKKVEELA